MIILIGKGFSEEARSERYVFIKSTSSSQLDLKMCDSNDSIETCGTWSYPSSYNGTSHFYIRSVNKDNDVQGKYHIITHIKYPQTRLCANTCSFFKYAIFFSNLEPVHMQLLSWETNHWDTDCANYEFCMHVISTCGHSNDYWMGMDLQNCNKKRKANQEER